MNMIPAKSVHLIITSPPYWQLKDYGVEGQIGFDDSYEAYINNLNLVWNECHRVLHPGCRLCVNIGDQFARSVYYGRYKVVPIRTEIIKFCETVGFDYMGAIIWRKVTTTNTTGGASIMGSFPYPRNGILKIDYEFILIFKEYGISPKVSNSIKEQSKLTIEEWNEYFSGHWNFPGEKQDKHLAMFPEELPRRLIKMFSFVEDTVLDPFLGSGTTMLAAKNLRRNSIGIEINSDFQSIIERKLGLNQNGFFNDFKFEVIENKAKKDFSTEISQLPYEFKDPVKFDKKVDPRKLRFGSKIDSNDSENNNFYSVKEIISPEIIVLDNGLKIRLLGISAIKEKTNQAIKFLREKTKNQKVFLKFDSEKYDNEGNLLCCLYLKNKTFINGHLLRTGYVDFDESYAKLKKESLLNYLNKVYG
ncbi:thermonuclease family protein [bacterium]|nr:thermonuclease family protein [FCB group bacterium]MBL7191081.1 thermonuclease family protein [bacterium]